MLPHDFDLHVSQIQTLSTRDAIVAFFATLGYNTDARLTQTAGAMGFPEALTHEITHIERIADNDAGALQVYLLELVPHEIVTLDSKCAPQILFLHKTRERRSHPANDDWWQHCLSKT